MASKCYKVSVDLSLIDKTKIKDYTRKNGEKAKFYDMTIWVNDQLDTYGNSGSVQENQTQEEREAGKPKVYLGNIKQTFSSDGSKPASKPEENTAENVNPGAQPPFEDDLPF